MPILITPTLSIPDSDLEEQFVTASGPGGQNVNKVASAVELRFHLSKNTTLREDVKTRLKNIAKNKINSQGILLINSKESRFQEENRKCAREKLKELIKAALIVPKARKKTRPTKSSKEKRLTSKKLHSQKKKDRKNFN